MNLRFDPFEQQAHVRLEMLASNRKRLILRHPADFWRERVRWWESSVAPENRNDGDVPDQCRRDLLSHEIVRVVQGGLLVAVGLPKPMASSERWWSWTSRFPEANSVPSLLLVGQGRWEMPLMA